MCIVQLTEDRPLEPKPPRLVVEDPIERLLLRDEEEIEDPLRWVYGRP